MVPSRRDEWQGDPQICLARRGGTVIVVDGVFSSAARLLDAMRSGRTTSVAVTDAAISAIEHADAPVNAVCVVDFERARAAARRADEARSRGDDRPLLGVPVTVKESFDVAGLPTTWGLPQFADHVAQVDAVPVARMKEAGAVILGKTNVPTMLQDWQTDNSVYGRTNNPWDLSRTPGGSSGGSAAALAAGFGALSIGSDLAGSLRVPAHFCGIYAHKPTFGLVPTRGMKPPPAPAWPIVGDLGVCGPMARTAEDLSLLLDVIAGPDPLTEGLAYDLTLPPPRHDTLAEYRVLVLDDHPLVATGSAVKAGIGRVADALAHGGAVVERHTPLLPDLREAAVLFTELQFSAIGTRLPEPAYEDARTRADALAKSDEFLSAARVRGMALSHRDWSIIDLRREHHRQAWRQLFARFDAVVCPVTSTPAFLHNQIPDRGERLIDIDGVSHPYNDQSVWVGLATMPGLPATTIPTGLSPEGLPVGVQIIGPMFEDRTPLRLAELLEDALGGVPRHG